MLFIMVFALGLYNTTIAQEISVSSFVEITLTPEGQTTPTDKVTLIEGASFTSATTDGDVTKIKMNHDEYASNVDVYAILSDVKYSMVATAVEDLHNRYIGVQASSDYTNYVFTFNVKAMGRVMYLEDLQEHKMILLTAETEPYVFSVTANSKVEDRFRIYKPYDFQVCAYYDNVEITGYTGTDNIVITTLANDTIVNVAPTLGVQTIDLSDKAAGHYVLTVNGTQYEFCNKPVSDN